MPERRARALLAARRVAARVREAHGIAGPGCAIDEIARAHAEVHETQLPSGYCALVVHGDGMHPCIHIDPEHTAGPLRTRATLAHALAHVMLGWHLGMCGCEQADGSLPLEGTLDVWHCQEAEADAFARELLVPRPWLRSILQASHPVRTARDVRAQCHIPAAMAAQAVSDELPPGHIWAVCVRGHVRRSGTSSGTSQSPPQPGTAVETASIVRDAREHHILKLEDRDLHWWTLEGSPVQQAAALRVAAGTAHDILESIVTDLMLRPIDAQYVRAQVTSIAGWAVGERPAGTQEDLVELARSRAGATNSPQAQHVRDAMEHPLLADYVTARAVQSAARKTSATEFAGDPAR